MCKAFAPGGELHIDPAEAAAVKGRALVYTVVDSPEHDREAHVECGKRIKEIKAALAANKLTAEDNPRQVRVLGETTLLV